MIDASREQELNEALELFFFSYREFTAYPDEVLAARGLGRVHHRILYFVGRNPDVTVGDLLGILGVSKQALNAPLRRLMAEGLVVNAVGESDRRARHLRLSDAGAALERELSGSQRERMAAIFSAEGPEREAAWRAIMSAVASPSVGREA